MLFKKLTPEGTIPPSTVCPWKERCTFQCSHLGEEHRVPFSCGMARAFDISRRLTDEELRKNG